MGFKKTSEGRVYFKSPDNDDAPEPSKKAAASGGTPKTQKKPLTGKKADTSQLQILSLLKTLNGKLKETQDDRDAVRKELEQYKTQISTLEKQVETQKSDYIDLEDKVSRKQNEVSKKTSRVEDNVKKTLKDLDDARDMVKELEKQAATYDASLGTLKDEIAKQRKKEADILNAQTDLQSAQSNLEAKQKEQGEKMDNQFSTYKDLTKRLGEAETRYDALENKIEESNSEYLKLDRKIDKVIEDRNRMLRKVERIEQTVLETRDALNAKAMVLLTDQGSVAGVDMPQIGDDTLSSDPMAISRRMNEERMMPWWRRPIRIQTTSLVIFALLILMIGWILSSVLRPTDVVQDLRTETGSITLPKVSLYDTSSEPAETNISDVVQTIESEPIAPPERTSPTIAELLEQNVDREAAAVDDATETIDVTNSEQLAQAFDRSEEQVAARLNDIEPGEDIAAPLVEASVEVAQAVIPPKPPLREPQTVSTRAEDAVAAVEEPAAPAAGAPETDVSAVEPAAGFVKRDLLNDIRPDSRLNDMARRIEAQALEGVPEAQHDMGALYVAGHGNVNQDLGRAVIWFKEAANNGVPNAIYNLGVLHHQGMGVDQSLEKAISLYRRAASLGHAEAQYNLGIANIEGIGVPYNPGRAARFFESAARKGVVESAYNLGLIYENGLLGEARPDEALLWYKRAADAGNSEAQSALQQLVRALGIEMSDVSRIVSSVENKADAQYSSGGLSNEAQASLVSQIQEQLQRRGLYSGDVDGIIGPNTRNAIRSFQDAAGLSVTGEPSTNLLQYLRASDN